MNKTTILILIVLLLGGVGAIFAWNGDDGLDLTPEVPDELFKTEKSKPIDANALLAAEEEPEASEELLEGLDEITRTELKGDGKKVRPLVVQVWDRKKGVAAAEAEVYFLEGLDKAELRDPFVPHWSDFARARGQKFKTDEAGRVRLPPVQDSAIVSASRPGSYGFVWVGRGHKDPEIITLRPDEIVTVKVIDGAGRPVQGVPVGVVQHVPVRQQKKQGKWGELMDQMKQLDVAMEDVKRHIEANPGQREAAMPKMRNLQERQRRIKGELGQLKEGGKKGKKRGPKSGTQKKPKPKISARPELRAQRRTDKDGLAVFRHFQIYRHERDKWWPNENTDRFEAVLLMPLQQPEGKAFSGRPVPKETIELLLPPTGSLALRTVDLDGRPYTHPVTADLRIVPAQSGLKPVPWARMRKRKGQNEAAIVFPLIGLGLQLTAHCKLDDNDFRWNVPAFAGPAAPGEQITIDVVVAPKDGMLFGRLLDSAGTPLAAVRPSFLINSRRGRLEGEDVTTDKDGRFHLPYQARDHVRGPFRLEIRRNDLRPTAGVAMALPALPMARITDLGDLRLDAFGKIAHGTVTDDRGEPIVGARIQLQRQCDVGQKQPQLAFVDEAFNAVRSDEGGLYELFGELEPGRYRLRVEAKDHFALEAKDQRDLRPGEQLDLQLMRKSRVVGTVLVPDWLPGKGMRVVLQSVINPKQRREDRVHDHRGKKYIYFDWVKPDVYSVQIRIRDFPDPIYRVDGIRIEPGQLGLHPRLTDINLATFVHRFQVSAVDGQGGRIKPGWPLLAQIVRPGGKAAYIGFPWRGPTIEIVSTSPQLQVWPFADGYRAEPAMLAAGESQLRFLKIPPVELHLPGMRQLLSEKRAWVHLQLVADSGLPGQLETWDRRSKRVAGWYGKMQKGGRGAMLGNKDSVRVQLMLDGRYRVTAYLLGNTKNKKTIEAVPMGVVNVRLVPGSGPQKVRVQVDAKKLQQALAQLVQQEQAASQGK